jgi:hypothetical protein
LAWALQPHLMREARHVFTVHQDMFTLQERGDVPKAIGGLVAREALDGGLERRLVTLSSAVIAAAP